MDDVTLSRVQGMYGPTSDLLITIAGLGEIQVVDQFYASDYGIQKLAFPRRQQHGFALRRDDGHHRHSGQRLPLGPDYQYRRQLVRRPRRQRHDLRRHGNNTYAFWSGFGTNTINKSYHSGNTNTIEFHGIDPSHIRMWTDAYGYLHLQDTTDTSHSITFNAGIHRQRHLRKHDRQLSRTYNVRSSGQHDVGPDRAALTSTGDNSGDTLYGTAYGRHHHGRERRRLSLWQRRKRHASSATAAPITCMAVPATIPTFSARASAIASSSNTQCGHQYIHLTGIDPARYPDVDRYSGNLHLQDTTDTSHNITVIAGITGNGVYESTVGTYFRNSRSIVPTARRGT